MLTFGFLLVHILIVDSILRPDDLLARLGEGRIGSQRDHDALHCLLRITGTNIHHPFDFLTPVAATYRVKDPTQKILGHKRHKIIDSDHREVIDYHAVLLRSLSESSVIDN